MRHKACCCLVENRSLIKLECCCCCAGWGVCILYNRVDVCYELLRRSLEQEGRSRAGKRGKSRRGALRGSARAHNETRTRATFAQLRARRVTRLHGFFWDLIQPFKSVIGCCNVSSSSPPHQPPTHGSYLRSQTGKNARQLHARTARGRRHFRPQPASSPRCRPLAPPRQAFRCLLPVAVPMGLHQGLYRSAIALSAQITLDPVEQLPTHSQVALALLALVAVTHASSELSIDGEMGCLLEEGGLTKLRPSCACALASSSGCVGSRACARLLTSCPSQPSLSLLCDHQILPTPPPPNQAHAPRASCGSRAPTSRRWRATAARSAPACASRRPTTPSAFAAVGAASQDGRGTRRAWRGLPLCLALPPLALKVVLQLIASHHLLPPLTLLARDHMPTLHSPSHSAAKCESLCESCVAAAKGCVNTPGAPLPAQCASYQSAVTACTGRRRSAL